MRQFRWMIPAACLACAVLPAASEEPGTPPAGSAAPPAEDVEALRREIEELKAQVRLLQDQMRALAPGAPRESALVPAPPPSAPPPLATPPAVPAPPAPAAGVAPARSQSLLNPAISAVMQVVGATSLDRRGQANGFDLSEAEIAFQSDVDPYARVDLFLSFPAGETPEVEEGAITTLDLPGPLQVKGGRFKSAFGKWNPLHTHAFFSVDRPNALVNFLGEESFTNDGLSLSVLVPNPWDQYIDLIVEAGTAREGPAFNSDGRHLTYLGHLTWFLNPGDDATLELGLSDAIGWTAVPERLQDDLAGCGVPCAPLEPRGRYDSTVQGVDVTYKWKPRRLNVYKSFLWQTEFLRSRRQIEALTAAPGLAPGTVTTSGAYSHVEWQLTKRWRIGGRYDISGFPDSETAREKAASAVVRFQPSEFQELRFQLKRTTRNAEAAARFDGEREDNRIFFEWIPAIGAHGAHKY